MGKSFKRMLALLLSLCLVAGLVTPTLAVEADAAPAAEAPKTEEPPKAE